jgi:hypothetical protein
VSSLLTTILNLQSAIMKHALPVMPRGRTEIVKVEQQFGRGS